MSVHPIPVPDPLGMFPPVSLGRVTRDETAPASDSASSEPDAEEPALPSGYVYGPPPAVVHDSNYISDAALLTWLAEKQDGMYGKLREQLDTSKSRSKLMQDLTQLKQLADSDASSGQVAAEMQKLLDAYRGTEHEPRLQELLDKLLAKAPLLGVDTTDLTLWGIVELVNENAEMREQMSPLLESEIDALGRDDQLALIEIQSLTADLRETSQLASNLLASANQASNTIVGNIRG